MGAYNDLEKAFAGLNYGLENRIETLKASESIDFGMPIFGYAGDNVNGYKYKNDESVLVLDGDLVASNVYTVTLTIDGVAQTPVAETYATSHDATMTALAAAIETAFPTATVTVSDANNRTLTIFIKGSEISATGAVTLGAGQAGVTVTVGTQQVFMGIASYTAKTENTGLEQYAQYDAMNVLISGYIYVEAGATVSANNDAYVVTTAGALQGKFGTSGYATNAKYRENSTNGNVVLIEVRRSNNDTTV